MTYALCKRLFSATARLASSKTVFALSSGHGKCGVAVVRASGPATKDAMLQLTQSTRPPPPRMAQLLTFYHPHTSEPIDKGLLLWFPAPHSFTGEDVAEFHIHGSTAVQAAILSALGSIRGLQHAEPGDFTKRAFYNGKLDLTEVEGLADLIHAETEAQRKQALRQMEGALSHLYTSWSKQLLTCVAHTEAVIDFGEDENIEDGLMKEVEGAVSRLAAEVKSHLNDGRRGEILRSGLRVAILGAPNAGKSSLLNILCQRPAAIVSPQPGTTRDVVESTLDIGGYPIVLSDTAGLREATDPVEEEGVRRALKKAVSADLRILVSDVTAVGEVLDQDGSEGVAEGLLQHALPWTACSESSNDVSPHKELTTEDMLFVMNKTDLLDGLDTCSKVQARHSSPAICWLSCKTGSGVVGFMAALQHRVKEMCGTPGLGSPSLTQARHRQHLENCLCSLHTFLDLCGQEEQLVCAAEELRRALHSLGHITGKVGVTDILDVIFKDFCIGK